jgi:hypothetical protein
MVPLVPVALALAQYAPNIMRFFGAGENSTAIAEKVVSAAQVITGAETPEEALAVMKADAVAQAVFQTQMLAADTELEKAFLADRQDARKRDVLLAQAGFHNRRADIMVGLDVLGIIACLLVLVFFRTNLPGEVVGLLSGIVGIFGAGLRDAHQFEFGSSRGSQLKDLREPK